jgi:molecular chaperone GrpE
MGDGPAQDEMLADEGVGSADREPDSPDQSQGTAATDSEEAETDIVENRISELQRDLTSERDKMLRLAAEFDNYRKRMIRERLEAEARGKAELVKEILEPFDDIARFAHVDPAVSDSTTLVEGVAMVERKLEKTLRSAGLETVNPIDEPFDPAKHEAVGTEPAESPEEDGTVGRVYQVGYTFRGQLLRPARVVVRQYTPAD